MPREEKDKQTDKQASEESVVTFGTKNPMEENFTKDLKKKLTETLKAGTLFTSSETKK